MLEKIIACVFFTVCLVAADPVTWKDGEFLLWSYGKAYVAPGDFCFALRYENEKIGNPTCVSAGDWERDTTVMLYAKWLNINLNTRLDPGDLRPRNHHVTERLRTLKDKSLLYSTIRGDSVWFLLFDETSLDPVKISVFSVKEDSVKITRKIASSWFGKTPERRLSDAERLAKEKEPDAYFAPQPKHDFWFGLGTGWSRAKIPLTPDSWYRSKLNSKVKGYRDVRDSSSVWNFLKDSSPIYSAYIGGSLYDFIGLEFEFRHSTHNVKIDETDEIYNELSSWDFNRYEFLLSLIFMKAYMPNKHIEIKPYTSLGFFYSKYSENIELKEGEAGSYDFNNRFEFESYYRGVALTLGLRTAFFQNYAINLRTGIMNRVPVSATEKPIGRSTTDGFISAGLEYHIRWIF